MEQNSGSQNKMTEFLLKNQIAIIVVALIALLAIIYFVTRGNDTTDDQNNQQTEQTGENNGAQPEENQNTEPTPAPVAAQPETGNVTASGTLRESDNAALGNIMVESDQGKIYISTARDFSALMGQNVTLNANGTLDSFTFLGFNEAAEVTDETAMGGDGESAADVTFNGVLRKSDQPEISNYMLTSGTTTVYYMSARNYDAWLNSDVQLSAEGTLDSFTNGLLIKR